MADEDWRRAEMERKRRRDREDESDREFNHANPNKKFGLEVNREHPVASSEQVMKMITEIETKIDQVNQLYNQYFNGVEKRPPIEKKKQLDIMLASLQVQQKSTSALRFRYNGLMSKVITFQEKWDRLLKRK